MPELFTEQLKPGLSVNSTFALRAKKLLPLRDGTGHFLAVVLGDKTGEVEGRVWESIYEVYHGCRVGDIVHVLGQVTEYNGKVQIQISAMTVCQKGGIDPGRFIRSSKLDLETVKDKLFTVAESLKNTHLKNLLSIILSDQAFIRVFVKAPAAKRNHHAAIGGLAEHSLSVAAAAERIAEVYSKIDRDLLVASALLHDIGKVEEYHLCTGIDFTDEGRLLGHIVLGVLLLDRYINQLPDFPEELRLKLTHMLVSHHGQYEWQSPRRPKFLEAAILHHLDMIDAEVDMFNSAVENRENEEDSWTGWVKGLDRYVFCK